MRFLDLAGCCALLGVISMALLSCSGEAKTSTHNAPSNGDGSDKPERVWVVAGFRTSSRSTSGILFSAKAGERLNGDEVFRRAYFFHDVKGLQVLEGQEVCGGQVVTKDVGRFLEGVPYLVDYGYGGDTTSGGTTPETSDVFPKAYGLTNEKGSYDLYRFGGQADGAAGLLVLRIDRLNRLLTLDELLMWGIFVRDVTQVASYPGAVNLSRMWIFTRKDSGMVKFYGPLLEPFPADMASRIPKNR